jgi:hypothetical protein
LNRIARTDAVRSRCKRQTAKPAFFPLKNGFHRRSYPVGIADVDVFTGKPASSAALRSVAWFLYRGSEDHNDSVDYRDCYSESEAELIRRRFGSAPAARWPKAQRLYADAHLHARLALYPGVGHGPTPAIREDIAQFFEERLREAYGPAESAKR